MSCSTSRLVSFSPIGRGTIDIIGPGVERFDDAHDRDSGRRLSGHHGPVNWRGAAVTGQQRCVHVDEALFRNGQHRIGQDLAVRSDDAEIGIQRPQALEKSVVTQAGRLQDGQAELFGKLFDRSRLRMLATPARSIGLRDDSDNRMPRIVQGLKSGNREFWSAEEDDPQRRGRRHHFPARAILRIFLTIRSRLMPRTRSRNSFPSR